MGGTTTQAETGEPIVRLRGVTKLFSGSIALDSVDLEVWPGEIHALVGANGAGKSTLGKLIAGVHAPDGGAIEVDGHVVRFASPSDALESGIAIMQQEIALCPELSAVANVFLGREPRRGGVLSPGAALAAYHELAKRTGFDVPPDLPVKALRLAEQQQVAVMWAMARNARVVVMDEATASLDRADAQRLMDTAGALAEAGVAVIYVSHFLHEVKAVSQRVTVLRNGKLVSSVRTEDIEIPDMVEAMIGAKLSQAFPSLPPPPQTEVEPVLEVVGLSVPDMLHDISLSVRPGEILGIFGLVGSGRSEFVHAVFGGDPRPSGGTVRYHGQEMPTRTPARSIRAGIALVPESRKDQGLFLDLAVLWNTAAFSLARYRDPILRVLRLRKLRADAKETLDPMELRGGTRLDSITRDHSGGNQQKVLVSKALLSEPEVLILDEPTRGVDVGAKKQIYELLAEQARSGKAVILVSCEEEEVLNMAHRVAVFRRGRLVDTLAGDDLTIPNLVRTALGANTPTAQEAS